MVQGLNKRPPTEHIAKLIDGTVDSAFIHTINRDLDERYIVIITSGVLKVFDLKTGLEKTVNTPDGVDYITDFEPRTAFKARTINDFTFIVNKNKTVAMTATKTPSRGPEGLVYVRQGVGSQVYQIFLNGTLDAATTAAANPSTATIASDLKTALVAAADHAQYTHTLERSVIWTKRVDGADFELKIIEPASDAAMKAFKKQAQRFTDLPTIAPTGYVIEIVGDNGTDFDNYFVKFVPNNVAATFDAGYWKEAVAENIDCEIDAATMPHVLIRESDGTFTFKKATWDQRGAGDDKTNPVPSFVGNEINNIIFHKNRLGFLSDTNVILSGAGSFFQFFRKTVITLLDDDPIDVAASHDKVAVLRSGKPFNEKFLVFSDQTQFILEGGDLLTPKSAALNLTTEFECSADSEPVNAGQNVYFAARSGDWMAVHEFFLDPNKGANDAADVTAHVPRYIPASIGKLTAETNQNIVVALCAPAKVIGSGTSGSSRDNGQDRALYAYNYFWNGNTKLQSSWGKWTFNGDKVLNVEFIDAELIIIFQRTNGVCLEKMRITPGITDDPAVKYSTLLDRRVNEAACTVAYDAATNMTWWTLPYDPAGTSTYQVVTRYKNASLTIPGVLLQGIQVLDGAVGAMGDQRTTPVWIGQQYTMSYEFSDVTVKDQAPGGGQSIVTEGRLQVLFMSLVYAATGFFKVKVEYDHRPKPSIYKFLGRILGVSKNKLGVVALEDGKYRFFVNAKADECKVTVINDSYLPSALQSAGWEGNLTIGSRRI